MGDIAAIVIAWFLTAALVAAVATTWKAPSDHRSYKKPAWWVWRDDWWRGYRRALPAGTIIMGAFTLGLTLPPPIGIYVGILGMVVFLGAFLPIILFNRPRVLVPPRGQGGGRSIDCCVAKAIVEELIALKPVPGSFDDGRPGDYGVTADEEGGRAGRTRTGGNQR